MPDPEPERDKPVYAISVAADLVNMHPQTLRQYERRGLVTPQRDGKNRLYSQNDIDRIAYIQKLTQDLGVNLAGVEEISRLQQELERQKQKMHLEIQRLHSQIADLEDRIDDDQQEQEQQHQPTQPSIGDLDNHESSAPKEGDRHEEP